MRIAFVYDAVYPETKGGVEKRVWELARRLVERGHQVELLVPHAWDGPGRLARDGVILRGVCRSRPLYTSRGRRAVWPALAHAVGVFRLLRRETFDLVDCQIPAHIATIAVSWAHRPPRPKLVVTWHEAWDESWIEEMGLLGHVGRRIESMTARLPAVHMAVSRHTAEALSNLGRDAVAVVASGVDASGTITRTSEIPPSDILFVGRMVPTKNLGLLIDAISILVDDGLLPRVIAVGDGPNRNAWEDEAGYKGLTETIQFVGILQTDRELMALLEATKVLALPSIREGFGMIALEAAAHGIPVVTVDHPRNAARHLVQHGVNGLCVPPTAHDFAAALKLIIEDDQLREHLSRGATESARSATWDDAVDETELAYGASVA
jgi:L-malate glycosyltransferase